MARKTNPFGKSREVNNPYATYRNSEGWEWRVLKTYQHPDNVNRNHLARWFCAVKSPMTHGTWDMGDVYIKDVIGEKPFERRDSACGRLSGFTPEWQAYHSHHPIDTDFTVDVSEVSKDESEDVSRLLEVLFAEPIFDQKAH